MTQELLHAVTEEIEMTPARMQPALRVFADDMASAICQRENCEYKMGACSHQLLATELLRATIDHYAVVMSGKGWTEQATFLRSEM